jgi:hypothetical protein
MTIAKSKMFSVPTLERAMPDSILAYCERERSRVTITPSNKQKRLAEIKVKIVKQLKKDK